ncbi:MAG: hypothetical protein JWP08_1086 [Bryobacterales bacterium]|nr:hypothetical protein [Bryobacterales bacterium]
MELVINLKTAKTLGVTFRDWFYCDSFASY